MLWVGLVLSALDSQLRTIITLMPIAAIALGGNIGNVPETFSKALAALTSEPQIGLLKTSRNFSTQPIGEHAGEPFINAVALLDVNYSAQELLCRLQGIEDQLGRVRTVRWGPRTLDLDILSYGDEVVIFSPEAAGSDRDCLPLSIPHPACWYRRFVLDPWCDVAPDWRHPQLGETVKELRKRLLIQPLTVAVTGDPEAAEALAAQLRTQFDPAAVQIHTSDLPRRSAQIILSRPAVKPAAGLRAVQLPAAESEVFAGAVQILRAALDQPVPLAN